MPIRSILLLFLLTFGNYISGIGQQSNQKEIRFNHLTTENGLSSNIVYSIFQNSAGYIWFGSLNGIIRYDGNTFERFIHKNHDSNSIADNQITCICEDTHHFLWIGTAHGLSCFNPVTKKITNYYFDKWSTTSGNNLIITIHADHTGILWIGTNTGLYTLNPVSGECINIKTRHGKCHGVFLHGICSTRQGRLFVAFDTTLQYSDDGGKSFKTALSLQFIKQKNLISSLSIDKNERLWIGNGSFPLIYEINSRTLEVRKHTFDTAKHTNSDSNSVACVTQSLNDSILMIGAVMIRFDPSSTKGGGFYLLNTKNDKYIRYEYAKNDPYSLTNNYIYSIYTDKQQTVWLATPGGINYFNFKQLNFQRLEPPIRADTSIFDGGIDEVVKDNKGTIWISTYDNRLISYIPSEQHFSLFSLQNELHSRNSIWCIYPTGDSLLVSAEKEIKLFDIEHQMFKTSPALPASWQTIAQYTITAILKDKRGLFWFATELNGIYEYFPTTKETKHYLYPDEPNSSNTPTTFISANCLAEDAKGTIWVGTSDNGVCCIYPSSGKVGWANLEDKQTDINSLGYVDDIFCDTNDFIYLATSRKGLLEYNTHKGIIHSYLEENGMANDRVLSIFPGKNNDLWLTTQKGLSCFDKSTKKIRNYFKKNGLISDEFSTGGCIMNSGYIILNCEKNLEYFDPSAVLQNNIEIYPEFTFMQVNNKEYDYDSSQKISLGYKDNTVSFSFSAFDFISGREDKYAYKLEGLDADWNYCGSRHFAEYTNLPGGNYTLKLKVQTTNGTWFETARPILLHIGTPYWKTWWFFMLCGLSAFALGYLFYYLKNQRKVEAEKLRTRLARDLHDDIGSWLSSISILSDMAVKNMSPTKEETQSVFNKISESSHKTMESMKDIVWTVDPENDIMDSLVTRMRIYCSEILELQGIEYDFKAAEEVEHLKLPMEMRRNLYLIFKEAINNIVKYSKCKNVHITILKSGEKIEIKINDNGTGFDVANASGKGNGLKNMKERAKLLNGNITIASARKEGTTVTLLFPLT